MKRAIPVHTIVRFRPSSLSFYAGWRPIEVLRFRLFVDATHESVTGEPAGKHPGAHWDHDWACESLNANGTWNINGRNEWPTPEACLKAVSENTFETFAQALREARKIGLRALHEFKRRMRETQWHLDQIDEAKEPTL